MLIFSYFFYHFYYTKLIESDILKLKIKNRTINYHLYLDTRVFPHHRDLRLNTRNLRRYSLGKRDESRIVFNPFIALLPSFQPVPAGWLFCVELITTCCRPPPRHAQSAKPRSSGILETAEPEPRDSDEMRLGATACTMRRPGLRRDAANNGRRETPAPRRRA